MSSSPVQRLERIREENDRIERTRGPYVSIAYLVPLPHEANDSSEVLRPQVQRTLRLDPLLPTGLCELPSPTSLEARI